GAVIALVSLDLRRVATRQSPALKVLWALLCAVLLAGAAAGIAAALSIPTSADGTPVVEGRIEKFHPMPPTRHDVESFEVNGGRFVYAQGLLTFGFNQDVQAGGPIREGLPVRTHYDPARSHDERARGRST